MDASWEASTKAGIGIQAFNEQGELIYLECQQDVAYNPAHAEAKVMLRAIQWAGEHTQGDNGKKFALFSDCNRLVTAINLNQPQEIQSWQALDTVALCLDQLKRSNGAITIKHASRQTLQASHEMANQARRTGLQYKGGPIHNIPGLSAMDAGLNSNHFRVQTGNRTQGIWPL